MSSQMSSPAPVNSRCASALAEQCRSAREEVAALLDERMEQLAEAADRNARQAAAEEFNRAARSLRRYENQEAWAAAVLDGTAPFAERAALFLLAGISIKAVKARNLGEGAAFAGLDVPI